MPAEGQPNIADAFDETRRLIIAASNLAAALDDTQAQGLHAVICAAEENSWSPRLVRGRAKPIPVPPPI